MSVSEEERAKMEYMDYLRPIIADADTGFVFLPSTTYLQRLMKEQTRWFKRSNETRQTLHRIGWLCCCTYVYRVLTQPQTGNGSNPPRRPTPWRKEMRSPQRKSSRPYLNTHQPTHSSALPSRPPLNASRSHRSHGRGERETDLE
jgi:hypothetical protein